VVVVVVVVVVGGGGAHKVLKGKRVAPFFLSRLQPPNHELCHPDDVTGGFQCPHCTAYVPGPMDVRCAFFTMGSAVLGLASLGCGCCTVRVFHHGFCCVRVSTIGLRLLHGARFSTEIHA
jgi:hypothetical protein